MNAWKCSGLDSRALGRKEMVDDDNDVHVNACCLTKQLQSLLWNKVGCDFKIIEYITESFRSYLLFTIKFVNELTKFSRWCNID